MAKKGLTTEKVIEREKAAFEMFTKDPTATAKAVRTALKKKLKFGMRLGRLYELKRDAASGRSYSPKSRKGAPGTSMPPPVPLPRVAPVAQAPRKGHRVTGNPDFAQHPAVQEALRVLEAAGFRHISIDGYLPMHYSQAPLTQSA
jgi:hypothetical protein